MYVQADGKLLAVHAPEACQRPCPIHGPSDHPLNRAPIQVRFDLGGLILRVCEHRAYHPDPDSVHWMRERGVAISNLEHGCDGCCEAGP
jgi:hypothetical protein